MLIISLSTIPSRFNSLGKTLESLLAQDVKIDSIELYIPKKYRRFPDCKFQLPIVPPGVTVRIVDEDFGPATKILPACRQYHGQDVNILFCDDDQVYPKSWARSFLRARESRPFDAIANCGAHVETLGFTYSKNRRLPLAKKMKTVFDASYLWRRSIQLLARSVMLRLPKPQRRHFFRKSGYIDFAAGFGGVMIKPSMLDSVAFEIPERLWSVDDIWLSGMLARRSIGIWGNSQGMLPYAHDGTTDALAAAVIEGLDRRQADEACANYLRDEFGIWTD